MDQNRINETLFNYLLSKLDPINKKKCLHHKLKTTNKMRAQLRGSKKDVPLETDANGQKFYAFGGQERMVPKELEATATYVLAAAFASDPNEIKKLQILTGMDEKQIFDHFNLDYSDKMQKEFFLKSPNGELGIKKGSVTESTNSKQEISEL